VVCWSFATPRRCSYHHSLSGLTSNISLLVSHAMQPRRVSKNQQPDNSLPMITLDHKPNPKIKSLAKTHNSQEYLFIYAVSTSYLIPPSRHPNPKNPAHWKQVMQQRQRQHQHTTPQKAPQNRKIPGKSEPAYKPYLFR
jgi:hypothetical protein